MISLLRVCNTKFERHIFALHAHVYFNLKKRMKINHIEIWQNILRFVLISVAEFPVCLFNQFLDTCSVLVCSSNHWEFESFHFNDEATKRLSEILWLHRQNPCFLFLAFAADNAYSPSGPNRVTVERSLMVQATHTHTHTSFDHFIRWWACESLLCGR